MDRLAELLGSEARARLLTHFVVHPDARLHLRALARHTGIRGKRSLQLELDRLLGLGLLECERVGRRAVIVRSAADRQWDALAALVREYAPALVLRHVLADLPGLKAAFIFGSYARNDARPDSDIDLLVYGDDIPDREWGKALLEASLVLDRRVDARRYDARAFVRDARPGASFLPSALNGPKLWLFGSAADLPNPAQAAA